MKRRVVITGGGTGGHIYPGVAIAQEVERLHPDVEVHFVGAVGGLEEKILPKTHFAYHLIQVGRLHSSVGKLQQIKTLLSMPLSLWQAFKIFRSLKPEAVLGVGGFASGPFLLMGWLMGVKTALWEPNAYPGLTNRWLSRLVDLNFIVFHEAAAFLSAKRVVEVGLPVRREFFIEPTKSVDSSKLKVLVFGGSQGSRAINDIVSGMVIQFPDILDKIELRHQSGANDFHRLKNAYGFQLNKITLMEYIHDMPAELHNADIVICRSGASTVAEVIACKKPAIFIPLPTAADNHQFKNAEALATKNAAIVLEQKNLTPDRLRGALMDFCLHAERGQAMSANLGAFDFSNAAEKVVTNLIENRI